MPVINVLLAHNMRRIKMKNFATLFLCLFALAVHAEEQFIAVPGEGWGIRFDAPKLSQTEGFVPSIYYGQADRFQLSFFVETPRCSGPDTYENIYDCRLKRLLTSPYILSDSIRANTKHNGVHVMTFSRAEIGGRVGTNFGMHLLFARKGKWVDIHASFASPIPEDVKALAAIMDSIRVEERP